MRPLHSPSAADMPARPSGIFAVPQPADLHIHTFLKGLCRSGMEKELDLQAAPGRLLSLKMRRAGPHMVRRLG